MSSFLKWLACIGHLPYVGLTVLKAVLDDSVSEWQVNVKASSPAVQHRRLYRLNTQDTPNLSKASILCSVRN